MDEDKLEERERMSRRVERIEEDTLILEVDLPTPMVVKYHELLNAGIPERELRAAWAAAVRQEMDKQYENKGAILRQIQQRAGDL